jgi:hypothetical protein
VLENPAAPAERVVLAALENLAVQAVLAVPENPAVPAVQVALVVLENPVAPAVRVALAVLEKPVVPAVQVALAVLEKPVVPVALAVLENPVVLAALVRQLAEALVNQAEVVEKEVQTRSAAISRRGAAAVVAPSLAAVGALLKPRAAGVAVA